MINGAYIIEYRVSDVLWRAFAIHSNMLKQVISGCRAGVLFLEISGSLEEASSHNGTGRAEMVRDWNLGSCSIPENLNLSPLIRIPWPGWFWGDRKPHKQEAVFPFLQRSLSVNTTWQWGRMKYRLSHMLMFGDVDKSNMNLNHMISRGGSTVRMDRASWWVHMGKCQKSKHRKFP